MQILDGRIPVAMDEAQAILIASRHAGCQESAARIVPPGSRAHWYGNHEPEEVPLYVPWNDGTDGKMLQSSRIIVVSRVSGRILYDGSASDEG